MHEWPRPRPRYSVTSSLANRSYQKVYLGINSSGHRDLSSIRSTLRDDHVLASTVRSKQFTNKLTLEVLSTGHPQSRQYNKDVIQCTESQAYCDREGGRYRDNQVQPAKEWQRVEHVDVECECPDVLQEYEQGTLKSRLFMRIHCQL